eukprot:Hpha_TRINITY_DN15143_c2_g7::TRINITY_DN15143_c2_g7_i1::g.127521::m.127521
MSEARRSTLRGPVSEAALSSNPFERWRQREADERHRRSIAAVSGTGDKASVPLRRLNLKPEPAVRFNHGCAADESNVYVFGGVVHDGHIPVYMNDFWRLSLSAGSWEKLSHQNAPIQREGHSMALRNDRVLVVFGGINGNGELNDVHLLDTNMEPLSWKQLHPLNNPPRRTGHSALLYRDGELMIVFGGKGPQGQLNDLWVFYFGQRVWREVRAHDAPGPRWQHTATEVGEWMYVFGGGVQVREKPADGEEPPLDARISQQESAAGEYTDGRRPALKAGRAYVADSNDMYMINLEEVATEADRGGGRSKKSLVWWSDVDCDERGRPTARRGHASVAFGSAIIVCGGQASSQRAPLDSELGDLWLFDVSPDSEGGLTWQRLDTAAPLGRRWGHRAANIGGKLMFIFGGMATAGARRDIDTGKDLLTGALALDLSYLNAPPPVFAEWPPGRHMGSSNVEEEQALRATSDLVHRGNSFGVHLDRHYLLGGFSNKALLERVAHQQAACDDAQIVSDHDPAYAMNVDWKQKGEAVMFSTVAMHGKVSKWLGKARSVLERTDFPCVLCGGPHRDAVLMPCGHVIVCLLCATDCLQRCPACQAQVFSAHRFFERRYDKLRHLLVAKTPARVQSPPAAEAPRSPDTQPISPSPWVQRSATGAAVTGSPQVPSTHLRGAGAGREDSGLSVAGRTERIRGELRPSTASRPQQGQRNSAAFEASVRRPRSRGPGRRPELAPRPRQPSLWRSNSSFSLSGRVRSP